MAIDMSKMRADRKKVDKPTRDGVDILKFEEGEYLLYITPPVHEEDPVPYVEAQCHFSVGPNNRMVLNAEGLTGHPPFLQALAARKVSGTDEGMTFEDCRNGWQLAAGYASRHRANKRIQMRDRWYFGCLVMATRRSNRDDWEHARVPEFNIISAGKTIYNGVTDIFFDVGDLTDPDKAILVKITRKGKGLDTEYSVTADVDTLREPMQLSDEIWGALEPKLQPGEDGDLYKLVAQFCRTEAQVQAVLDGTDGKTDDDEGAAPRPSVRATPASGRRRRSTEAKEVADAVEEAPAEEAPAEEAKPSRRRRKAAAEPAADEGSVTAEDEESNDIDELEKALASRSRRRRKA